MKNITRLLEYNKIIKENDNIYRNAAKAMGIAECVLWILYTIQIESQPLTQSEICNIMYQPKQTVNSALKNLKEDGYIELFYAGDHRKKQIRLTGKGIELAQKTSDKVIKAELSAFSSLSDGEQETFIKLFKKYTKILNENMQNNCHL